MKDSFIHTFTGINSCHSLNSTASSKLSINRFQHNPLCGPGLLYMGMWVLAFIFVSSVHVQAQSTNGTWANVGTSWNTAANWVSSTFPNTTGSAIFNSKVTVNPNLSSSVTIGRITTGATALDAGSSTISSSSTNITLTLTAVGTGATSAIMYGDNAGNTLTISAPIVLGSTTVNQTVTVSNASSTVRISGAVSGSVGLSKADAGTLVLAGANTYTGVTTNSGGVLALTNGAAILDTGAIFNSGGATLRVDSSETIGSLSGAGSVNLNGSGVALTIAENSANAISGVISNNGSLVKTGTGTTTLTGANTYSGTTTISGGALRVGAGSTSGQLGTGNVINNGTLIVHRSDTNTIGNVISGTGSLINSNATGAAGALTLTASNSYSGGTTLNGNNVNLNSVSALGTGTVTMNLASNASSIFANFDGTLGNAIVLSGASNAAIYRGTNQNSLVLTGNMNSTATSTLSIVANNSGNTGLSGSTTFRSNTVAMGSQTMTILNQGVSGGKASSDNQATVFEGVNFSSATNINISGGLLRVTNTTMNIGGQLSLANNFGQFQMDNGSTVTVTGGIAFTNFAAGGLAFNGGTLTTPYIYGVADYTPGTANELNTTFNGTRVVAATSSADFLRLRSTNASPSAKLGNAGLIMDTAGFDVTIASSLANATNATGTLTKQGNGLLNLSASNSYTGNTTVNAGLLKVVSGGSISSSSTTVNSGGTFDVGGSAGNVQVNSGGLLKGSGSVGAFTIASGGILAPGNSPGTLTAASAIVLGGATYRWEISTLSGTAGTNWDLLNVTGLLNMDGVTSENKWNLVVTGDSGFTGWTGTDSYSYVFAQAASVSGFSSTVGTDVTSLFNISTSGITSKPNASFNANGDFKVVVGSDNGRTTLNLMAVPEPSTGSMLGLGLAGLVVTRLLRRKSS